MEEDDIEVDIEGDDEDDAKFVPGWSVKRGTRMNNANVCRDMMINLATPGEERYLDTHNDTDAIQRAWLLLGKMLLPKRILSSVMSPSLVTIKSCLLHTRFVTRPSTTTGRGLGRWPRSLRSSRISMQSVLR